MINMTSMYGKPCKAIIVCKQTKEGTVYCASVMETSTNNAIAEFQFLQTGAYHLKLTESEPTENVRAAQYLKRKLVQTFLHRNVKLN